MPSDKCSQYQQDYEKLLELKQEFDVLLKEGEVKKDFSEAKKIKNELAVTIDSLTKRVVWEYKTHEQLRVMFAGEDEEKIKKYIKEKCIINNKDKTVIIKNNLYPSNRRLEFIPENLTVDWNVHLDKTDLKTIGSLTAGGNIWCQISKVEEITGDIISDEDFCCQHTPLKSIRGNINAVNVDLSNTPNLTEIFGQIECFNLDLQHTGLKKIPENIKAKNVYISRDNQDLLESWKKLIKARKISSQIFY